MTKFPRLSNLDLSDSDDESAFSDTPRPGPGGRPSTIAPSGTSVASSVSAGSAPPLFRSPSSVLSVSVTGGFELKYSYFGVKMLRQFVRDGSAKTLLAFAVNY